jgi:hypothetical protein
MPETSAGKVVVRHFNNILRIHRLPFQRPFCRPPPRTAWSISRETLVVSNGLELISQSWPILGLDSRRKSDVME